jgi:hypothetical protein
MPKLHDFRADFSAGRTGHGLRIRQDTEAYRASLYDANNMMVVSDARVRRRFGTLHRQQLAGKTRLESWKFSELNDESFLLLFSEARLDIYDLTMTLRHTEESAPWTGDAVAFLSMTNESNRLVITDQSFRTQFLTFDQATGDFEMTPFEFDLSEDQERLRAPFVLFAKPKMRVWPTNFLSAGTSTGYASYITTAYGSSERNLSTGSGKLYTDEDFFLAAHEGSRVRIGKGEVEITSVIGPREVECTVYSEIGVQLSTDPFYFRDGSDLCEVAAFDHNLKVGDVVFFAQINAESAGFLTHAVRMATNSGSAPAPADGAAGYTVRRVVDKDHFEIRFSHGADTADAKTGSWSGGQPTFDNLSDATTAAALPSDSIVSGGADVIMIPFTGLTGLLEPAFSEARGWPQACAIHETRLWLGGTRSLPDAAWASRLFNIRDFDTGEGDPDDALTLYSIGNQSRVRHIVPGFDTVILTDNGEYYVPGSNESAITPSTARAIPVTKIGCSYTQPYLFDGGIFFVDGEGQHIRETVVEGESANYSTNPATIVVPDWVKLPTDATVFMGSAFEVTPYLIWVNDADGSLLLMHSRRRDGFFGFMRWSLAHGEFKSVTGIKNRLFAAMERDGEHNLIEFDTSENFITMDFGAVLTSAEPQTEWNSPVHANTVVQMQSGGNVYTPAQVDENGDFTTPEPVTKIRIGEPMPWLAELNPPIAATGQGPKIGKLQRLVSAEVHWSQTETGRINDESILTSLDVPALSAPTPVDEWRQHIIGDWGREPRMRVEGNTPGHIGMRGVVLNVYF